ncbi:tektin-2-like [Drosophila montana]|uniref:tektin-2-like n=1 Tax=Drosophila montana TaxID=40370 RepID=UPI00313B9F31
MAINSVVTMEKPLQHISLSDWNERVGRLRNVATARLADTFAIRKSSRVLRDETRIEDIWANYESNVALTDRILELTSWREIIAKTYERIENEIHALEQEKILTERDLDALSGPITVISEMLNKRDSRLGSEITYDEPDKEIKNELYVLENNQRLLSDRCRKAWEKLTRLADVRIKISMEVENKIEAVDLERKQRELDRNSTRISFKTDSMRYPTEYCTYEGWLEHTKNIKLLAENEMADTVALRESLFVCREKARSILQAQQGRTEYVIRKRIFETQRARNELKFQMDKMNDELKNALIDIQALEDSLCDKTNSLKLAETRLENRAQRRNMELCLDYVHDVLCFEVKKQREIHRCLMEKIEESRKNYNLLGEHALQIATDLEKKEHALITDKRALEIRQAFKESETGPKVFNPCTNTDRNIILTNTQDLIPKS